jgi:hypothetical protein
MSKNTNRVAIKTRDTSIMAGIDKHMTAPITLGGKPYTPAELKAAFQAEITALDANEALRKSLTDGVVNAKAVGAQLGKLYQQLRWALMAQYGPDANAILNDYGMTAPKAPGPKTIEAKATAKAKSAATRTARHTMGSSQKKSVHGNVVAIQVTPVLAGPAPAEKAPEEPI